jgi:hypothetical protein
MEKRKKHEKRYWSFFSLNVGHRVIVSANARPYDLNSLLCVYTHLNMYM